MRRPTQAGDLRDRVMIFGMTEAEPPALDEFGNPVAGSDEPDLTLWANVRETLGKEKIEAGRLEDQRTATLRIRRSPKTLAIDAGHRAEFRGRTWDIKSVAEVGIDRRWIDILVELRG